MKHPSKTFPFSRFISFFPPVDLPVLLTEDAHHGYSKMNEPLPKAAIEQYLHPYDRSTIDEYTEYIPCFSLKDTHDFHAIVYYKAHLLVYEYFLMTFSPKGEWINKEKIAGMVTEGEQLHRAVASIEPDWAIHIVEGAQPLDQKNYEPKNSKSFEMELLSDGHIVYSMQE